MGISDRRVARRPEFDGIPSIKTTGASERWRPTASRISSRAAHARRARGNFFFDPSLK